MPAPVREAVRFWLRPGEFGRRLRAAGIRPGDVAAALEVSPATVSRWRARSLSVRGDHALRLAALLNAPFPALFERTGP